MFRRTLNGSIAIGMVAVLLLAFSSPSSAATYTRWVNLQTWRCLDSNYSGQAYTAECITGSNNLQIWIREDFQGRGAVDLTQRTTILRLRNARTGQCLDSNTQGRVYTLPCTLGNRFQGWFVTQVDTVSLTTTYRNLATGRCLDSDSRGQVYALGCNGGLYQVWANQGLG
jgi:hypothetical protein